MRPRAWWGTVALGAALPGALACDGDEPTAAWASRDSAGVEVVESFRPAWEEGRGWRVGDEPVLRIGVVEGDEALQLTEVVGAVRLEGGAVAVGDASQEVRFFDAQGEPLGSVGGPGQGPGEFSGLSALGRLPGGGVWAYDFSLRRMIRIGPDRRVAGTATLDPEPPVLDPVGALPDGTLVLKQLWGAGAVAAAGRTGLRRDPVAWVRFDSTGALVDTVGLFPGREVRIEEEGGRGVMITPPFGRTSVGAVRGGRIVVGSQDSFELRELAPDGSLLRLVRIPSRDAALDPVEARRFLEERVEAAPPERRAGLRATLDGIPLPETRPAYGGVRADVAGNLWVSEWAPFPRLPSVWTVLGPEGRWLGEVAMPSGFQPLDIGDDWIVGLQRDAMDVEFVVAYPLAKPGGRRGPGRAASTPAAR